MNIRSYEPADLDAIVDIYYRASVVSQAFLGQSFLRKECENIREVYIGIAETIVASDGARVAGFVAMIGDEVGGLFVDPTDHRRGIGRALLDYVKRSHSSLEVEVFAQNAIGRAFYHAYGFQLLRSYTHQETGQITLRLRC